MNTPFRPILRALAITGLLALAPQVRADIAADLTRAEVGFMKAVAGEASPDPAVEAYAALVTDETSAPLVLVYLGSAQTLQGREAWLPWNKIKAVERGLSSIDKALRQITPRHEEARLRGNPIAAETRLVAATNFLSLPDGIFHRADQGRSMLRNAVTQPGFAALPPTLRARYHQQLAIAASMDKTPAEVAEQLRLCLAADEKGPVANDCRRRLKEINA